MTANTTTAADFNEELQQNITLQPDFNQNNHNNSSYFTQSIPITYVWFGKSVPEDYMIYLSQIEYPLVFLKNPPINRQFNRSLLEIEKADYYRLQHLYEFGGLYSDFDNKIDYGCLMNLLEPYRFQNKLIFLTDGEPLREKNNQIMNNMIFAPHPKMPILKQMLEKVDETKQKIWKFAGMSFVAQFQQVVEVPFVQCFKHDNDWSWWVDSNQVLGNTLSPMEKFVAKNTKKSDILTAKIQLQRNLQTQKSQKLQLSNEFDKFKDESFNIKSQLENDLAVQGEKYTKLQGEYIRQKDENSRKKAQLQKDIQIQQSQNSELESQLRRVKHQHSKIKALLEHDLETQKTISSGLAMGLIFVVLFFFMFKKGKFQITKMEGNMQNSSSVNTQSQTVNDQILS